MSEASCVSNTSANIYEEKLTAETVCDCSSQGLRDVPKLENQLLSVIYLQNNQLTTLPDDFFPSLPGLMYLDLRNNLLTDIPKTVMNHHSLTHLLLQNNNLTSLPNELGTVVTLKVLQLNGNPLTFPPKKIISAGVSKIIQFLGDKLAETLTIRPPTADSEGASYIEDNASCNDVLVSYNSFADIGKIDKNDLIVLLNEKEDSDDTDEFNGRLCRKCPKLAKSRRQILPSYLQSSKYVSVAPTMTNSKEFQAKIKEAHLKRVAIKKRKEFLDASEKILQERKNVESLKNWRKHYLNTKSVADQNYRLVDFPYGTYSEYMTLLTRADIEKDLPDKYRRKLIRKGKPSVPRRGNTDIQLAIKIKQLFQNLEAIDLNRDGMTPRTEQNILRNEIKKITEINQKLKELSTTNINSVVAD